MNTVHLSPRFKGALAVSALSPNSSIFISNLSDCSSRKEPVPAAHILFISKSTTTPFSRLIYLESWPPISKIVSTSLSISPAAVACAVISLMIISAPTRSPIRYLPEPVVPTALTFILSPTCFPIISIPFLTASIGLPAVLK